MQRVCGKHSTHLLSFISSLIHIGIFTLAIFSSYAAIYSVFQVIVCKDNALTILFIAIMWVDSIAIMFFFSLHFLTHISRQINVVHIFRWVPVWVYVIKTYDSINSHCCLDMVWWCMSPTTGIIPWPNTFDENFLFFMIYFP